MSNPCRWCATPFPPKPGKLFCSDSCRNRFNGLARAWALKLLAEGMITVETLKTALGAVHGKDEAA